MDNKEVEFDLPGTPTAPLTIDDLTYFTVDLIDKLVLEAHVAIFPPILEEGTDANKVAEHQDEGMASRPQLKQR